MAGSPAPPPPSKSNSSAPAFKSNASGPSPRYEPAQGSSTSPAAAAQPVPVPVPSDALVAVFSVVGELHARGFLAGFEIPKAEVTEEGASALFDGVLTAFLAELAGHPAVASWLPIPPPPLGDGRKVELVSLFLAVRARGGFSAVASWAAVAEAVGLDPTADTAVKLLYGKYLALLEQNLEDHMVVSSGNADLLVGSKKGRFLSSPTKRPTTTSSSAGSAHLKRKRDTLVGMLDWVRLVAKNPGKQGKNPGGHKRAVIELRRQMFADKDCLAREELVGMLNWVRGVAASAGQPGIIGMNPPPPDHLSTAVELRSQISLPGMLYWLRLVATSPAEPEIMEGSSLSYRSTALLFRSKKFANIKDSRWSAASPRSGIPLRPCGQADIPEWTGKPSSTYYDDPRTLRFLGEPILLPGSTEDPDGASIGKGRQDDCNCKVPGSITCVRFHVAEKKIKLKDELGSAYFEMGFHRIGEDLALRWTNDEERKFNTTIQENLPSSTNKFWDKLLAVLHDKGRKGLVSYYHNVFQVWRRAYQNRLGQNADSDDDSIEPGLLYARQRVDQSSSKSAGSSRKRRRS